MSSFQIPLYKHHEILLIKVMKIDIIQELYQSLTILGADHHLLCAVGSYGDTLSDEQVLTRIQSWNSEHGDVTDERQPV